MPTVARSALVNFSVDQMYALVADIPQYPVFLEWCDHAAIDSKNGDTVLATVGIAYKGVNKRFTTRNVNVNKVSTEAGSRSKSIDMQLVDGPFSKLIGRWGFSELSPEASKVELNIEFEISNMLLRPVLGPVFGEIIDRQVSAFISRAESVYGTSASSDLV
ncbi:MAG TPA: ubiquinone-binding protein [Gammaproteobacteria bacterium]|jgi:ribosome-associated toxin RatA of RatAB toxin-antitoxin module|nr:type II toxin-antitoxin system RatA family toxin [Pseudomonadota bacterium]HAY45911.1 ubiquinone-binding protein [Gammaproteobacteria bacterium]